MNKIIIVTLLIVMMSSCENKIENGKKYPIRIEQVWGDGIYIHNESFDVDSIRGDTLWKDGNHIKLNNIKNIKFN
jgi:hypothetical protein